MRNGNAATPEQIDRIFKLKAEGFKIDDISSQTGIKRTTVVYYCSLVTERNYHIWTDKELKEAARMLKEGYTTSKVGEMMGISRFSVYRALYYHGYIKKKEK